MNLYRKTYVKNWKHMKGEELHDITITKGGKDRGDIDKSKVAYITEEMAYWRKQNAIHNWIVKNCGEGIDKCQEIYINREDMGKLLTVVNTVLAGSKIVDGKVNSGYTIKQTPTGIEKKHNWVDGKVVKDSSLAEMLLPTAEGFFFGSTDYDEWYITGLTETKEVLERIMAIEKDTSDYYYQASW